MGNPNVVQEEEVQHQWLNACCKQASIWEQYMLIVKRCTSSAFPYLFFQVAVAKCFTWACACPALLTSAKYERGVGSHCWRASCVAWWCPVQICCFVACCGNHGPLMRLWELPVQACCKQLLPLWGFLLFAWCLTHTMFLLLNVPPCGDKRTVKELIRAARRQAAIKILGLEPKETISQSQPSKQKSKKTMTATTNNPENNWDF